jgi:alpha-beta hydrolase superfamily lysophospholipase
VSTYERTFQFTDADGFEIFVYEWAPDGAPRAALQIAHGAVEHALRYRRLAEYLNERGYVVYANDHRAHGRTAGTLEAAGRAGEDGWNGIIKGFAQLTGIIKERHPGIPVFVLGHSMGSIVVQQYIERYGDGIAGAILSGSWGAMGDTSQIIHAIDVAIDAAGRDAPSELLATMFGSFNERFDGDTGFEWLSRDTDEVRKYVDDPWCGSFAFSNGFVRDFFSGMEEAWRPENEATIPKSLPVLIVSGERDPAGGYSATTQVLIDRYQALGLDDLTAKLYPDARHEILNETNRDEVHSDIAAWMDARLPVAA